MFLFRCSGVPEHGAAIGHDGPVRGSGIRAEAMWFAGWFAFQGPCKPRDQPGVCTGNVGQTARRPGKVLGRGAGLQASSRYTATVLQLSGEHCYYCYCVVTVIV